MSTATILTALNKALMRIGSVNGTARPFATNDEKKMAAWEYYVADNLAKLAETRKKNAMSVAIALGALPDYKKHPLKAGQSSVAYDDDVVGITVSTRTAAQRFDKDLFLGRLKAKHPKLAAEVDALVADCTTTNAVPHIITPALKE